MRPAGRSGTHVSVPWLVALNRTRRPGARSEALTGHIHPEWTGLAGCARTVPTTSTDAYGLAGTGAVTHAPFHVKQCSRSRTTELFRNRAPVRASAVRPWVGRRRTAYHP